MGGEKEILIFSDAGGTGRSYHAELSAKNYVPKTIALGANTPPAKA